MESFNAPQRADLRVALNRVQKYGDGAPEAADLYFSYGKALLENAISQSGVLGKEQAEETLLKEEAESCVLGSPAPMPSARGT